MYEKNSAQLNSNVSSPHQQSRQYLNQMVILAIVWLSLALRLVYLVAINEPPADGMLFAPLCGIDAHIYDQYAQEGLAGVWPYSQPFDRSPLYTLYLLVNYYLFGVNHYVPLLVQALLQAVATAALYAVGRLAFSPATGLLAALGFALYNSLIFYTGCFAQVSLVVPLLTLTLFFILKAEQVKRLPYLILAGLTLGLAGLGRPNLLLLLPAVVAWLWLRRQSWRRWLGATAYFTSATLLIIAPLTFYNYQTSGNFVLISSNGPVNLFIANNPETEGRDILAPGIAQPVHRRLEVVSAAVDGNETTYTREVLNYIRQDPLDWLALQGNKLWLLFGKSDLNILSVAFMYPTTDRQIALFETMPVHWSGLVIAALLGMLLVRGKDRLLLLLFLVVMTLATIIFFVQLRFRLLLAPLVLLYAAALLAAAPGWFRSARPKFYVTLFILILCLPFVPAVWPFGLAFIGIGFWQAVKLNRWPQARWPLLAAWSLFVLAILAAQVVTSVNRIGQPEDYYLGPDITGNITLGQTFQPDCDGLHRIRLTLGIYNERHDQPIIFYLRSQTTGQDIFVSRFTTEDLSDRTTKEFTFFPQPDSSQQTYLAYLTSPTSQPGNSITLRGFSDLPLDGYAQGTAIVGQGDQIQPFPGDLAFTAFCKTNPVETINTALTSLPGSRWVYWLLLGGHAILFIVALYMMRFR